MFKGNYDCNELSRKLKMKRRREEEVTCKITSSLLLRYANDPIVFARIFADAASFRYKNCIHLGETRPLLALAASQNYARFILN